MLRGVTAPLRSLALVTLVLLGCASTPLARQQHPAGLARILIGEEAHIEDICVELQPGAAKSASPITADALAAEQRRDACRVASVIDPALRTRCDLATARTTIETAMAKDPPPWLRLVMQSSGAWKHGKFDAALFSARFDFTSVLARKLGELGDRAASYSQQLGQAFGRFAGAVQLGIDLLVAEVTAVAMERLLDQPAVRALAEPTELARLACRQLDDGQSRPLVTRRILKRTILRLDPPTAVQTPGQLCAESPRPAACSKLAGASNSAEIDAMCSSNKHHGACDHLWFLVASRHATPLSELCKEKDHPDGCERLARSGSIDDSCRDAALPHQRMQCYGVARWFAERNLWHSAAAENVCWSNPSRCARLKRKVLPDEPPARPLIPRTEIARDTNVESDGTQLAACFTAADALCGERCPAGASECDDALACIAAACEIVATRELAGGAATIAPAAIAGLREAVAAELAGGVARRVDLLPIERGVAELGRSDRAVQDAMARLPGELGNTLRSVLPEIAGRGTDSETMRRLRTVLEQIEAKQARVDRAHERQRELASRLETVARTAGFEVRATETGVSVVLTNVLFEDSASDLSDDARGQVCKVADTLGASGTAELLGPGYHIDIVGFSSPTGIVSSRRKDDSNMLLSIDRAYAAYDWMTKNPDKAESRCGGGKCRDARSCATTVPQDRVQVIGRGYNDEAIGRDEVLRRVEIHIRMPELAEAEPAR
jgi:outer membrane protein OmpA-like peptidoglycan-associated protein